MLYPKNSEPSLPSGLFENPTSEYRGTPFWAWNSALDRELLLREIDQMQAMGFGGFHIHCRSGLSTPYLGEEFFRLVSDCHQKAVDNRMLCWLYDEDRWPSGAAGGLVTKDHAYRSRFLVFSPAEEQTDSAQADFSSSGKAVRGEERRLLARYEVELSGSGCLAGYRRLGDEEKPSGKGALWEAFLEISGDNPWFNNEAYLNTLDPKAVARFVEVTHDTYARELGKYFGSSVPAIFTDEPQFTFKECLDFAQSKKDVVLPYTDDFDETFREAYGVSILDRLPELFWEMPNGKISTARYQYHDHIAERFAAAFADQVGGWCDAHGLMLTGHMDNEPTLDSQTVALGDCMRSYRSFQLPGIDMLCDDREFSTAKQASSAAHQYGRPGVMSELYGVTNWDFDFRGHKLAGDWQAALGVTVRVPHLNWVSMAGEAKRDYPAAIGYQSPWYREYPMVEDHFARVNTALTRGRPHVRVAMIHPVESYWLHWGPKEQTALVREELDEKFKNITEWLLFGLIDFDYVCESLLPEQFSTRKDGKFSIGCMDYDVVLVPGCETLRSTTLDALERFRAGGGRVLFLGEPAKYVDAAPSGRAAALAKGCDSAPFTRSGVLGAIEDIREADILAQDGSRAKNLFCTMRDDGANRWLFICHVNRMANPDIAEEENILIRLQGTWKPTIYDTMTGKTLSCGATLREGRTEIGYRFSQHDSLLLLLEPAESTPCADETPAFSAIPDRTGLTPTVLAEPERVDYSEPNVLVLDIAEYAFDHGDWQAAEELLRIDNNFRAKLGYPLRMEALAQPWVIPDSGKPEHTLSLRFQIDSDTEVREPLLALENAEKTGIFFNGQEVTAAPEGFFTDESIRTVRLPAVLPGRNELVLHIPVTPRSNVEWCYLLGDFGVRLCGRETKLVRTEDTLRYGDWTRQDLPFYAGNVTYTSTFRCTKKGRAVLEASRFRAPLLKVAVDGKEIGRIAYAPYLLDLGEPGEGTHTVSITAFGNRINSFGALHNSNATERWTGPNYWRSTGSQWSYEYNVRPMGLLSSPVIWTEE